jgi:hypothetical protein
MCFQELGFLRLLMEYRFPKPIVLLLSDVHWRRPTVTSNGLASSTQRNGGFETAVRDPPSLLFNDLAVSPEIEFRCKIPKNPDHRFLIWLMRVVLVIAGLVYAGKEIWRFFNS